MGESVRLELSLAVSGSLALSPLVGAEPGAAAGGRPAAELQARLDRALAAVTTGPGAVSRDQLAVTLLQLRGSGEMAWAGQRSEVPIYPASVIKLFYLAAAHAWLEDGRLTDSAEMQRALRDMIVGSSNDATHYVVDLLTGTTSGPELPSEELARWQERRDAVNRHFAALGYRQINCNRKPWGDGPYGRELQAMNAFPATRRNQLTTDATARLLAEIALDRSVTPSRSAAQRALLARDPKAPPQPEDQTTGFIGEGLPTGARLWSKAGWTSQTRHDAALVELADGTRWVLVIFSEGQAENRTLLPTLTRQIFAR
ncbi:MAG: serine hydrolase [Verrucomicrobia bacterium]|nr:serine hydrolase [Verrucomicrobiota bacterium]